PLAPVRPPAGAGPPLFAAVIWLSRAAAGPLERRDPVQVPAFVAEESGTRDQPRTLVLGGSSPAKVSYTLVRGSGGRLGDAELSEAAGSDPRLDKVVANLVAGSGADQTSQLSGFAIRYVLVRDGAPRQTSRVLDATPGLSRLSQLDGSALWRVDSQIARAVIVSGKAEPLPVASGPVEAHTDIPKGPEGRVLRLADRADDGWQATLDGRPLQRTTVDGWAQGFELPAEGGRLDLTHEAPATHTAWIWAQGVLALVLVVLALPGRRREIDDDLPDEEAAIPAQPVEGEGRRARRLRAAQAEAAAESGTDPAVEPQPETGAADPYAAVPQQPQYGAEWDERVYADEGAPAGTGYGSADEGGQSGTGYGSYGNGQYADPYPYQDAGQQYAYPENGQYGGGQGGQYDQQQYDPQQPRQYDPQQQYDPRFGRQEYDPRQYDPYRTGPESEPGPYDPYGYENEQRPDGSSNQ
ncbi:family 2 glycosyl transferase, partial [Streptomyces sp. NPDC096153]